MRNNRRNGKGREIIYDDGQVADTPGGMSIGAGRYGNIPVTDEDLGNVADSMEGKYKLDRPQGQWEARRAPRNKMKRESIGTQRTYSASRYNADVMQNGEAQIRSDTFGASIYSGDSIPSQEWTEAISPLQRDQEVLEWMIVGVWALCLVTLTCCLCCVALAVFVRCKRIRKQREYEAPQYEIETGDDTV